MRTGGAPLPPSGQRAAAEPYPAMGAELPVRFDLAAAIAALLEELVKLFLELPECGLLPARLGLWLFLLLFVHGVPSVFPRSWAHVFRII